MQLWEVSGNPIGQCRSYIYILGFQWCLLCPAVLYTHPIIECLLCTKVSPHLCLQTILWVALGIAVFLFYG